MSKMLRYTKDELSDCKAWMGLLAGVMGGVWLFLEILIDVILLHTGEMEYFSMAALGALGAGGFVVLIVGTSVFSQGFLMAVSMGRTRRGFLVSGFVATAILALMGILFSIPLALLSEGVRRWLMPSLTISDAFINNNMLFWVLKQMPLWLLPMIAMTCVALGLVVGAAMLRFGRIGFWIIWSIFMVGSIGGGDFAHAYVDGTLAPPLAAGIRLFVSLFASVPGMMWPLVWLLGIMGGTALGAALLWRAPVK